MKTGGPHDGDPSEEGLEQLDRYLDQLGLETGTLVNSAAGRRSWGEVVEGVRGDSSVISWLTSGSGLSY